MTSKPSLTEGIAWHLDPQGQWKPEEIPDDVLSSASFSGYLTIDGYRATVFEAPDGSQWAQKSVGTPAAASSTVFTPQPFRRTSMGPKQTADWLRRIAAKIDAAKNPDKTKVIADLRWVLANMDSAPSNEQVALPSSRAGKQMLKKMLDDAKKALESGDDETFKTVLEKIQKHA